MKLTSDFHAQHIAGSTVHVRRTTGGVVEIHGRNQVDLQRGLGFWHAHDRLVQMLLVRLVGQGRLCECLKDDGESLAIDTFMRHIGMARTARDEVERLSPVAREFGQAYADGINAYLHHHRLPMEFRLVGYRPEPWAIADTLITINLMSYVGLAQTQQDLEQFLIQAIRHGTDVERLKNLFSPHLDGLTSEVLELIRRVKFFQPIVPLLPASLPSFTSSNNWVVGPSRSETGRPIACNDPHLECNRLPAVWYEVVLHSADDYQVGISMPGVPGVVMGRTRYISAGFTYGFMDMVDYFIEECRGATYRRNDGWKPFQERRETIRRKKHAPIDVVFYENEHGILECDPQQDPPEDGVYLCRAYSGQRSGAARSLAALAEIPSARTVSQARAVLRNVSISCNWLVADTEGNIGYQQSGLLPRRRTTGLVPVPGWWDDHAWEGLVPPEELTWMENPDAGFIATANNNQNQAGMPQAINVCQGSYRHERIAELLTDKPKLSIADMQRIQGDLLSPQARRYMTRLRDLLPPTPAGRVLAEWDLRYEPQSRGATLFEAFYHKLLHKVFGEGLLGPETWAALSGTTSLLGIYFQVFDEALLGTDESWFGSAGREAVFRQVLEDVLAIPEEQIEPWGRQREITMHNLFFGGKLPKIVSRLLGVDHGPITLPGGRATIIQGQIFWAHGRQTTFAPSYRSVSDLGTNEVHTALAGGPSGRILSGLYKADIDRWLQVEYKTIEIATGPPNVR